MTDDWERKVDHRLRALVQSSADPQRAVTVFVRFVGDPRALESLGLAPGTVSADVTTGSVALSDVPRLAAAPEVAFVELTRAIPLDEP